MSSTDVGLVMSSCLKEELKNVRAGVSLPATGAEPVESEQVASLREELARTKAGRQTLLIWSSFRNITYVYLIYPSTEYAHDIPTHMLTVSHAHMHIYTYTEMQSS